MRRYNAFRACLSTTETTLMISSANLKSLLTCNKATMLRLPKKHSGEPLEPLQTPPMPREKMLEKLFFFLKKDIKNKLNHRNHFKKA